MKETYFGEPGDKVRVKVDGSCSFSWHQFNAGDIVTYTGESSDGGSRKEKIYRFTNGKIRQWLYAEQFEVLSSQDSPLDLITNGCLLQLQFGKSETVWALVQQYKDELIYLTNKGHGEVKSLKFDASTVSGIKCLKIYGLPQSCSYLLEYSPNHRSLLWEFKAKRMTKSEIEKALGYRIEIIDETAENDLPF